MLDWTSIPLSFFAYLGGVATKPLQAWVEERRERKKLRRALYVEIANLLSHCTLTIEELSRDSSIGQYIDIYLKKLWPCQCYELAKTMPMVLNLLPDVKGINNLYGGLESLSDGYQETIKTNKPKAWFVPVFILAMRGMTFTIQNHLDAGLLLRLGDERAAKLIRGLDGLDELSKQFQAIARSGVQ